MPESEPLPYAGNLETVSRHPSAPLDEVESALREIEEESYYNLQWGEELERPSLSDKSRYVKEVKLKEGYWPKGAVRLRYTDKEEGKIVSELIFVRGDFVDLINPRQQMDEFLHEVGDHLDRG